MGTMQRRTSLVLACLAICTTAACSSGDALSTSPLVDASGTWSGTVTNQSNSCPGDFKVGDTTSVVVSSTQDGSRVTLKLQGGVGTVVSIFLGSDTFAGQISGDQIDASLLGTTTSTSGSCQYTWTANLNAKVAGDAMNGTVTYKPNPKSGDCSAIQSCSRVQSFSASRSAADAGSDAAAGG